MDNQARAAFIIAQAACMQAELAAMLERNRIDILARRDVTHSPADLESLPDRYGLSHNAVISYLSGQ